MRILLAAAAFALAPATLGGQHASGQPRTAPAEARQFDFLIGEWDLVVKPQVSALAVKMHGQPTFSGRWTAARALEGWAIADELRTDDASGSPRSLLHATRLYDATARRWVVSTADAFRGTFTTSTAEWQNGTMTVTAPITDAEGRPQLMRLTFYDITTGAFRYDQHRSTDGGKTWVKTVQIEARRAARSS